MTGLTLRSTARSFGLRRERRRARGRRERRREEANGTPEIERRPGPEGPRVSMTEAEMHSSRDRSTCDGEGVEEERRRRSGNGRS